jgi:hypothetical protein
MNNDDDWLNRDNIIDLQVRTLKGRLQRRMNNYRKSLTFWIMLIGSIGSIIAMIITLFSFLK